jgi:hypothetical protein
MALPLALPIRHFLHQSDNNSCNACHNQGQLEDSFDPGMDIISGQKADTLWPGLPQTRSERNNLSFRSA